MTQNITCVATYKKPALLGNFSQKIQVAIRLQGPPTPEDLPERSALRLAIVLDRSGSMAGRPLKEAKQCAKEIVTSLGVKDKVAIITYDNKINVVAPLSSLSSMENRSDLISKISSIRAGGMTNLFGGWQAGAKQLEQLEQLEQLDKKEEASGVTAKDTISRVLILSDGNANEGLTDPAEICQIVQNYTDKGISTSSYGLGDSFNEDLMVGMANSGNGSSYYGETAEDLKEPFMEELSLLNAICAKDLQISFQLMEGIEHSIINQNIVVTNDENNSYKAYKMMNLTYDGEAWLAFDLTIPSSLSGTGNGEKVSLGTVQGSFSDLDGKTHQLQVKLELVSLSPSAYEVVVEDEWLKTRLSELEVSEIQMQANKAAKRGDWDKVDVFLKQARDKAGENELLQGILKELEELAEQRNAEIFTKEVTYSHRAMHYSLSSRLADEDIAQERQFLSKKMRQGRRRSPKNPNP